MRRGVDYDSQVEFRCQEVRVVGAGPGTTVLPTVFSHRGAEHSLRGDGILEQQASAGSAAFDEDAVRGLVAGDDR